MVNYRDPKKTKNKNFAKPVVDIAASSRNWIWMCKGCLESLEKVSGRFVEGA